MKKAYLLLHVAVVLAGFTGVFGKLVTLNEGLLSWYRVFFSAVFLFAVLKLFGVADRTTVREKWGMAKVGMLITVHWVLFYASIKYANISVGVVCYGLTSFFTAVFKPLIAGKRFVPSELLLSAITLLGIGLIFHFDTSYQLGILLGVASSAFAALYTICNERLAGRYDSRLNNFWQMTGGTVGLAALLPVYLWLFPVESILPDLRDALYLAVLAVFCTAGLYVAVTEVLRKIPAFTVNLSFSLEPLYAIILAFLFFDEGKEVRFSFYAGLFFVMLSVALQSLLSVRKARAGKQ